MISILLCEQWSTLRKNIYPKLLYCLVTKPITTMQVILCLCLVMQHCSELINFVNMELSLHVNIHSFSQLKLVIIIYITFTKLGATLASFNVINKPTIQYIIKARINTCDFKIILIITSSCQQSEKWKQLIKLNHLNGN